MLAFRRLRQEKYVRGHLATQSNLISKKHNLGVGEMAYHLRVFATGLERWLSL